MSGVTGVTRRTIRNCYPAASSSAFSSAGGVGTSMYTEVSRILIFGLRVQVLLLDTCQDTPGEKHGDSQWNNHDEI